LARAIGLPAAGHRAAPWKNGLGISYTIADSPAGASFDAIDWQIGHTAIPADCPFSDLPGLDRTFIVLEGAVVELTSVDERGIAHAARVLPLRPYAFRGDWKTDCRLVDGPARVVNIVARRGRFVADVSVSKDGRADGAPGQTLVAVDPGSLDAWRLDGAGSMDLPAAAAIVVRIREA
jgi:environmental stress-induced protein Ves